MPDLPRELNAFKHATRNPDVVGDTRNTLHLRFINTHSDRQILDIQVYIVPFITVVSGAVILVVKRWELRVQMILAENLYRIVNSLNRIG